jgi:hypothetical protein
MEISRDAVEISVVIYPEDDVWIAQGIEFDITARGGTPVEASKRFNTKVGAELVMSLELGDSTPLSGIGRAPEKFVEMYDKATMRVVDEEISLHVPDGSHSSRLRPHIKISGERQRAA